MLPPAHPHESGLLAVGQGHQIHWEVTGNPEGIPALYLHGGPGSVLRQGYLRRFDLDRYRVVGVQQRGAGLSTPHASDPRHRLQDNTTAHLLDDLDLLRDHLGIDAWLVSGVSWGSTLALHHALRDRSRVLGLVLVAVTTSSPQELDWISEGMQLVFPEAWEELAGFVERNGSWRRGHGRLVEAMAELLSGDDDEVRAAAAVEWDLWEQTHIQAGLPVDQLRAPEVGAKPLADALGFARLVTHYWSHHAALDPQWVPEGGLLAHLEGLAGLPLCMVHGRRDISGPVSIPWAVKGALPDAQLHVVESEGHGGPVMMDLWRRATDSFANTGDFSLVAAR